MIKVTHKGSFKKAEAFLNRMKDRQQFSGLSKFGPIGVAALAAATPVESSKTANSWDYRIKEKPGFFSIEWINTNIEDGIPIAIILQYGHGTGTGGYIPGRDYINPAIRPIFDQIAADMWKVVTQ
jgi:hypothetical protein